MYGAAPTYPDAYPPPTGGVALQYHASQQANSQAVYPPNINTAGGFSYPNNSGSDAPQQFAAVPTNTPSISHPHSQFDASAYGAPPQEAFIPAQPVQSQAWRDFAQNVMGNMGPTGGQDYAGALLALGKVEGSGSDDVMAGASMGSMSMAGVGIGGVNGGAGGEGSWPLIHYQ